MTPGHHQTFLQNPWIKNSSKISAHTS